MKAAFVLLVLFIVGSIAEEANSKEKSEAGAEKPKIKSTFKDKKNVKSVKFPHKVKGTTTPPVSVSYVSNFGPIKDQKTCWAEWAMATADLIDYYNKKNKTNRPLLSEQNILDCSNYTAGCNGGDPFAGFSYAFQKGLSDATKYKYIAKNQTCQRSKYPAVYTPKNGCMGNIGGDENALKNYVASIGPFISFISTYNSGFDKYKSGLFSDTKCSKDFDYADTVVLIVGYGTDKTIGDFWNIRYFQGTTWGESGYMRMKRGTNMCGIANVVMGIC